MVTHVAVCGDSFGVGAGLPPERCYEDSFAGIVATHLNIPQKVYARSGCCNFTIYLQVKKVIEQIKQDPTYKPFVLVTTTFHERLIFPLDDGTKYIQPDLSQVEYLSYVPYVKTIDAQTGNMMPYRDMAFNVGKPRLSTETLSNMWHYQTGKAENLSRLFAKMHPDKMKAVLDYYTYLFDTGIKKEYDEALFVTMHHLMKSKNIPHIILGNFLNETVTEPNFMHFSWGEFTKKYPDPYGSGHCDTEGNRLAGEKIIKYIDDNNLI